MVRSLVPIAKKSQFLASESEISAAAGVSITLTAASTVFFAELFWTPGSLIQAEDRAHRIGQKEKVTYVDLISEGTVDEFIVRNLRGKINLATKVLGEDLKKWLI